MTTKEQKKEYNYKYYRDNIEKLKKYGNEYYAKYPEKIKEKNMKHYYANIEQFKKKYKENKGYFKEFYLKKRYNITQEEYNNLLVEQNNVCAICLQTETSKHKNGDVRSLSVDHCHVTGKVRGLLCNRCNRMLGQMEDNPTLIDRATKYLLNYEK